MIGPVPKISDEVCVLAVAEPRRQVKHAPVWIDMRITRTGKKDIINKEISAGSYSAHLYQVFMEKRVFVKRFLRMKPDSIFLCQVDAAPGTAPN